MSGLKQFYMKNIKIFTIILVLLAAFIAYKCYTKYSSAQKAKKIATSSSSSSIPSEKYRYGAELTELAFSKFMSPESATNGLDDTPLSRIDFGTYGSYSKDRLANIVRDDIPNLGYSGQQQQSVSEMNIPLLYTAYGGDDYSKY